MYIYSAPPERTIYIQQCRYQLFEKLGAVVFWEKCLDTPGGWPIVLYWLKRRFVKRFVCPLRRISFFLIFSKWKRYNRGRHRNTILNRSRWY